MFIKYTFLSNYKKLNCTLGMPQSVYSVICVSVKLLKIQHHCPNQSTHPYARSFNISPTLQLSGVTVHADALSC